MQKIRHRLSTTLPLLFVLTLWSRTELVAAKNSGNLHMAPKTERLEQDVNPSVESASATASSKPNTTLFKLQDDQQIASAFLAFWSAANDQQPSKAVQEKSGISEQRLKQFKNRLGSEATLDKGSRNALREPYKSNNRNKKFAARKKFINFVSAFQESFPEYATFLPEMLTAWGETRDISGFLSDDSMLLQAKMASVIQVLRNRTERKLKYSDAAKQLGEAQSKWEVATRRYQFTTFEPFDPNLAVVALGPELEKSGFDIANLSQHDQFALQVLSRVLLRLESGDIIVPQPLADKATRHYLTPRLVLYNKQREQRLIRELKSKPRVTLIRIPATNPKYLAVVPNWSRQSNLIHDPHVKIRELISSFASQPIPPKDFIYFHGVL